MKIHTPVRDFGSEVANTSSYDEIGLLGGEALKGSGFETQHVEANFQFDWPRPAVRGEGGDQ